LTNSGDLPHFRARRALVEIAVIAGSLALLVAIFATWNYQRGFILWYGDAQAHLNISRSLFDSQTPGYDQLGTVWLPLLHLLCLPFVRSDVLWSTGLAGTIPVAACFVFAGTCFYLSARAVYAERAAAVVVLLCFALNPNLLYLATIPMTEVVFLAGLSLLLLCYVRFRVAASGMWIAGAIAALWAMCFTRYDGWFLIPFAALWFAFAAKGRRTRIALAIVVFASLAPLCWMGFNWYQTGNALDFLNGPYSAQAIQAGKPYPGLHNWPLAVLYYSTAGVLCTGWPLLLIGGAGLLLGARNKALAPLALLCLTPAFYIWSIHSSQTPIFVPQLPPHGLYNSRYGIAVLAVAAFSAGALAKWLPGNWQRYWFLIPIFAVLPWLLRPAPASWITWHESQQNSIARREWTSQTVAYLNDHYQLHDGVLTEFGDLTGIFCQARIPLRDTLHEGNGPAWWGGSMRSDLFHPELWAITQRGAPRTRLSRFLHRDRTSAYRLVYEIHVPGAPVIEIYRRTLSPSTIVSEPK
jgi:hypothetical protein